MPLPVENSENISFTMHDHGYTVNTSRRHPFQDLTVQMNCISGDHNYVSVQLKPQTAESQVIVKTNNIAAESVPHQDVEDLSLTSCFSHDINSSKETSHELPSVSVVLDYNNNDLDSLSVLTNTCAASESVQISPSIANSRIEELQDTKIQKLQDKLKKQKEEIKTLQDKNKLLNTIIQKKTRKMYAVKSNYNKCRLKLWRSEQSKTKLTLFLKSRLRADQIASLERKSSRGLKWTLKTIKDALEFKMKWGTTGYSDFVNYLPIFPSVRTLQRTVEHIQFESGILHEIFDMLKQTIKGLSDNEKDCMIVADEMTIKAGLVFDPSTKKMIGKCIFPTHIGPAKKVLVIICGGINRRWKVVVAYFFTGKEDPKIKDKKANNKGIALKNIID